MILSLDMNLSVQQHLNSATKQIEAAVPVSWRTKTRKTIQTGSFLLTLLLPNGFKIGIYYDVATRYEYVLQLSFLTKG